MRIALVVCIYKRHDLEVITLENFKRQAKAHGFDVIVVGSEGESSKKLAKGCIYVEHENRPVSNKHNAGIKKAIETGATGVVLMGSDDIVSDNYFEFIKSKETSENVIGLKDLYFYSTKTKELSYFGGYRNNQQTVGAGRYFPMSVINKLNGELWDEKLNSGLDTNCTNKLKANGIIEDSYSMQETDIFLVDIKHSRSITNHAIVEVGQKVNSEIMEQKLPKKTVSKVKKLEPKEPELLNLDAYNEYDLISTGENKYLGAKGTDFKVNGNDAEILINKGFATLA